VRPKETTTYPDDEDALCQEAQRLATELLPMAMTGHPMQEGEDVMRLTCHAVPKPSEDLLQHSADAQKGGVASVAVWIERRIARVNSLFRLINSAPPCRR